MVWPAAGGYSERPARLPGAFVWTRTDPVDPAGSRSVRVLPDGCLDLIWSRGELLVAGPDTVAHLVPTRPDGRHLGVRFGPGLGPVVLGVPAVELRDARVPLAQLWPDRRVRRMAEQLAAAADPGAALDAMVRLMLHSALTDPGPARPRPDPALARVVRLLGTGGTVAEAAAVTGLGPRQLHRRSLVGFGYGAKTLARILRLNRALELARTGGAPAEIAAITGYADQPHLAREVKALAGVPLGRLLGQPG